MGSFTVNWASGDTQAVSQWLSAEAIWMLVGGDTRCGPAAAQEVCPPFPLRRVEITSIITHGRFASCDGYLEGEARCIDFSHVIRFASASRTAKIAELRTYCITTASPHS